MPRGAGPAVLCGQLSSRRQRAGAQGPAQEGPRARRGKGPYSELVSEFPGRGGRGWPGSRAREREAPREVVVRALAESEMVFGGSGSDGPGQFVFPGAWNVLAPIPFSSRASCVTCWPKTGFWRRFWEAPTPAPPGVLGEVRRPRAALLALLPPARRPLPASMGHPLLPRS